MSKHNQNVDIFLSQNSRNNWFFNLYSLIWYHQHGIKHLFIATKNMNYVACIHNYLQHLITVKNGLTDCYVARDGFIANSLLFITIWYEATILLFIERKHLWYAKYILDCIGPLIIVNRSIILLFEMISNCKSNKSAATKTDLSSFANNYILFCVSARLNCHLTDIKKWILNFG